MKIILRNCIEKVQTTLWNVVNKTSTTEIPVALKTFAEARNVTRLIARVTITDLGEWASTGSSKIKFRFAAGLASPATSIQLYIDTAKEIDAEVGSVAEFDFTTSFASTTDYPDTNLLKMAIQTTRYEEGVYGKTVKYEVKFLMLEN